MHMQMQMQEKYLHSSWKFYKGFFFATLLSKTSFITTHKIDKLLTIIDVINI